MIFVTLGASHFPFKRLIDGIVGLAAAGNVREKIIVQSGVTPPPENFSRQIRFYPFLPPAAMKRYTRAARLVITHGGGRNILEPIIWTGRPPIVVPRRKCFGEHVDDHQYEFARFLAERRIIIVVKDINQLPDVVANYRRLTGKLKPFREDIISRRRRLISRLIKYTEENFYD